MLDKQETKEIIFKGADNLADSLAQLILVFNCSYLLKHEFIANMGITYRNKIVELQNQYKAKGMSYYDSCLIAAITGYTANKVYKGFEKLKELSPLIKKTERFPFLMTRKTKTTAQRILEEYKALDDELFGFNLERDVGLVVAYDMLTKLGDSDSIYADNSAIKEYREELKRLGLSEAALDEFDVETNPVEQSIMTLNPIGKSAGN